MRTTRREFVDSNVWIYAEDPNETVKRDQARALLSELRASATIVVSSQVLLEFFSILTRKLRVPGPEARALASRLMNLDVVNVTPELSMTAMDLSISNQISHWDGLIIAAASARRCSVVWTEDMSHGRRIAGVELKNPFRT